MSGSRAIQSKERAESCVLVSVSGRKVLHHPVHDQARKEKCGRAFVLLCIFAVPEEASVETSVRICDFCSRISYHRCHMTRRRCNYVGVIIFCDMKRRKGQRGSFPGVFCARICYHSRCQARRRVGNIALIKHSLTAAKRAKRRSHEEPHAA